MTGKGLFFSAAALGCAAAAFASNPEFPTISAPRAVTQGPHDHFLANYFAINAWSADLRYMGVLETDVSWRSTRSTRVRARSM